MNRLHTGASKGKLEEASPFYNFTFRCIVDVRLLNNSMLDVDRIYPMDIGIKIPHPTY